MKPGALNKRIRICYVGPDDHGIWKRTLNSELKTLFDNLHLAGLLEQVDLYQRNRNENPCREIPFKLDETEQTVTDGLDLMDELDHADLVIVYLTRSNLSECNWAIGYSQGAKKKTLVLDGLFPNKATMRYNYGDQDFSYEAVGVDENHPDVQDPDVTWILAGGADEFKPIKASSHHIAKFILQNTELFTLPMIPRGRWDMLRLRIFWQMVIEKCWDDPKKLKKLGSVLTIYGCPEFMFKIDGWGQNMENPLGIEYADEQSYKELAKLMTSCHPWITRLGTKSKAKFPAGSGTAHVYPDEFGIRKMTANLTAEFEI